MSDQTNTPTLTSPDDIVDRVRERYAGAALRVSAGEVGCCGTAADGSATLSNLYDQSQTAELPEEAVLASLGLRQSHGADRPQGGPDRAGPRVRAAVSTCCSARGASDPPALPSAWT